MSFPFLFGTENGEVAVDVACMIAGDEGTWTWLHSSRSRPARLETSEWPAGLAKSVDLRNQARDGQAKGRVLIVRHGPRLKDELLRPVAVLDCGYRLDVEASLGRDLVESVLLAALVELNDHVKLRDRAVDRPTDHLGWAVRREDGAGSDPVWARAVATRAQAEWGFAVVKPKTKRPTWARDGFYGARPR